MTFSLAVAFAPVAQLVGHFCSTEDYAGSTPARRSTFHPVSLIPDLCEQVVSCHGNGGNVQSRGWAYRVKPGRERHLRGDFPLDGPHAGHQNDPMPRYAIRATPAQMEKFGRAVKARRKELSYGLRDLARRSGISYGMICHIEKGENYPSLQVYVALCKALKLEKPALT